MTRPQRRGRAEAPKRADRVARAEGQARSAGRTRRAGLSIRSPARSRRLPAATTATAAATSVGPVGLRRLNTSTGARMPPPTVDTKAPAARGSRVRPSAASTRPARPTAPTTRPAMTSGAHAAARPGRGLGSPVATRRTRRVASASRDRRAGETAPKQRPPNEQPTERAAHERSTAPQNRVAPPAIEICGAVVHTNTSATGVSASNRCPVSAGKRAKSPAFTVTGALSGPRRARPSST